MNEIPKIALVGCGYWGKNLCRNFHALNALDRVIDATESGQAQARLIVLGIKVSSNINDALNLSLIHISDPTRLRRIS